jgi:hypothetical protein
VARVTGSIRVAAPLERVFDTVADSRNEPSFNVAMTEVELLTPAPIGLGTRFRARMGKTGMDMLVELTEFNRPNRLSSLTTSSMMETSGTLNFTGDADATLMAWDWQVRPKGWFWALGPLVGPLGRRMERKIWTGLKRRLEAEGHAASILDRYLPEFDVRERQSRLLQADVGAVRAAIGQVDLTGIPVVRALLVLRALPGRLRAWMGGRATPIPPPFTLADMPRAGWIPLVEGPEEVAFGTLTQPWRIGNEAPLVVDREAFAAFATPGYAKVAFFIRADPDGPHRTRVRTETRVATTDPRSRRRFAAYWVVVRPLSALIRWLVLRRLARHVQYR